jgi:hypothetical protein
VKYSFTAASSGDIVGCFLGVSAAYTEQIGMSVNGGAVGPLGLNNQTSVYHHFFDLGHVVAGQSLEFADSIITTGDLFYSVTAPNNDGKNHLCSTRFRETHLSRPARTSGSRTLEAAISITTTLPSWSPMS